MDIFKWIVLIVFVTSALAVHAQKQNLIYIDKAGVVRYTKDNKEAAFFGVNYTVPFAYGYRSHKALGVDLEKAIAADVYHFSRLGLDAFRVHVWDVEISDSAGNLLSNEHLRLFDFLIAELKKRNIKILLTPIAFWGNGYPEPDEKTPGFSTKYGKRNAVVNEDAIKAQEKYLKQFFKHINPYTKLTYEKDPDIIAAEINNEPQHSGAKEKVTEYVNRLYAAIRSAGWSKPVFYNISESPAYADAVVESNADGYSFQWYPSGLVAGHERKGNFLPHVDNYKIPFGDTIPKFLNKPLMVYEFDAADIWQPIMYPAMARSFRTAGFWWATQFAYDPLHTAYGNTEYQTHYLNLVYTPAKAISLLIASKVFHRLPRNKSYGTYPADSVFDVFRVSYQQQLSEMNSAEEFYYSNSTSTKPKNVTMLKHIAGVGNSPVVQYSGTGAYFLDKLEDGVWRLEVMPDAVVIRDPFEKASPKKEVVRIESKEHWIKINLPNLTNQFSGSGILKYADTSGFLVSPGVYHLIKRNHPIFYDWIVESHRLPKTFSTEPVVNHTALQEVTSGKPFFINATVAAVDSATKMFVEIRNSSNQWKTVAMQQTSAYNYSAEVPAEIVTPGLINYRIILRSKDSVYVFPGGFNGDPYAWDEWRNESWQTFVAAKGAPVALFDPDEDRAKVMIYNPDWRTNQIQYTTADKPQELNMKFIMNKPSAGQLLGFQFYFADKIAGRATEIPLLKKLVVRARAEGETKEVKLSLITKDAQAFSTIIKLSKEYQYYEIPLSTLRKDSMLLLPRPYPGFLPLKFSSSATRPFNITDAEKLELHFSAAGERPAAVELESVWLKK